MTVFEIKDSEISTVTCQEMDTKRTENTLKSMRDNALQTQELNENGVKTQPTTKETIITTYVGEVTYKELQVNTELEKRVEEHDHLIGNKSTLSQNIKEKINQSVDQITSIARLTQEKSTGIETMAEKEEES